MKKFGSLISLMLLFGFSAFAQISTSPLLIGSADTNTPEKLLERRSVIHCFDLYQQGMLQSNADQVINQLSDKTIAYYESMLNVIVRGDKSAIEQLNFVDMLFVLNARLKMSAQELVDMDVNTFVEKSIELGLIGVSKQLSDLHVYRVEVDGQNAKAMLLYKADETGIYVNFVNEGNEWQLDLESLQNVANFSLYNEHNKSGLEKSDFIMNTLAMANGDDFSVSNNIWNPIR
jgi:hypothetical protein